MLSNAQDRNRNTVVNFRRPLPLTLNYQSIDCASTGLTQTPTRNQFSLRLPAQTPTKDVPGECREPSPPHSPHPAGPGSTSRPVAPAPAPAPPEAVQRAAPPHTITGGGGTAAPTLCPAVSAACPEPQPPAAVFCRESQREAAVGPLRGPRGGRASPGPEAAAPAGGAAGGPAPSPGRSCQPGPAGPGLYGAGGEKPSPGGGTSTLAAPHLRVGPTQAVSVLSISCRIRSCSGRLSAILDGRDPAAAPLREAPGRDRGRGRPRSRAGGTGGDRRRSRAARGRTRSRCLSPALLRRRRTAQTSVPQHLTADAGSRAALL